MGDTPRSQTISTKLQQIAEQARRHPDYTFTTLAHLMDVELLRWHTTMIRAENSFCDLATGAMEPLRSALEYFIDDIQQHIREKACPWGQTGGRWGRR